MTSPRPPRLRPLPPSVVAQVIDTAPATSRAELLHQLELALAALPPAERMAVVAAHGYEGGPVGAAIELDVDPAEAEVLTLRAVELLRAALEGLNDE